MATGIESKIRLFPGNLNPLEVALDFIKIRFEVFDRDFLLKCSVLDFVEVVSRSTGEVMENRTAAKYDEMELEIRTGERVFLYLSGSLHKQHEGGTNGDRFTFSDAVRQVIGLCEKFRLNPLYGIAEQAEFGVNLWDLPFSPDYFMQYTLFHQKTKPDKSSKNNWMAFPHDHYKVKIYNKGKQLKLSHPVLRYEVQAKTPFLNRYHVATLLDLINPAIWERLRLALTSTVKGLLIYDPQIEKTTLNSWDKKIVKFAQNPLSWETTSPKNFDYKRMRWREICENNLPNSLKNQIKYAIDHEARNCLVYDRQTCAKLIAFLVEITADHAPRFCRIFHTWENVNLRQIQTSDKGLIWSNPNGYKDPAPARYCLTCEADISHRRKDAKFCEPRKCRDDYRNRMKSLKGRSDKLEAESKKPLLFSLLNYVDHDRFAPLLRE